MSTDKQRPQTTRCPACKGRGSADGFVCATTGSEFATITCSMCHGTGLVSDQQAAWWRVGRAHYDQRVSRMESLREAATRLGILPRELSAMEHGRADPARLEALS